MDFWFDLKKKKVWGGRRTEERREKRKKEREKKKKLRGLIKLFFLLFLNDHVSNFRLACKQFLTELILRVKLITA